MKSLLAIVRREIQAYFVSPIAYTVIVGFLVISGFGFVQALRRYVLIPPDQFELRDISLQKTFIAARLVSWLILAVLLSLPALSMRLFTEERRGGTIELLLTSPLTTFQLVLGKFLGTMAVYAMILCLTTPYVAILAWRGHPEWAAIGTFYLGMLFYGAVLLAIGLFASSLTENQIVAVVLTYAMFLPFLLIDALIKFAGAEAADVLSGASVGVGLRVLSRGIVDSHYIVLFLCLTGLFLFLSAQVLDSSRWR